MCDKNIRREVWLASLMRYVSGPIQFHGALRARNAHITVYDVTTWSWVNLVNPPGHSIDTLGLYELPREVQKLIGGVWGHPPPLENL